MLHNKLLKRTSRYKHQILEEYLSKWLIRHSRNHRVLHYIDFFAGPGRYRDDRPGSPLVVLHAARKALQGTNTTLCMVLVEKDGGTYHRLTQVLSRSVVPRHHVQILMLHGDARHAAITLLPLVDGQSPVFCFIDPYGLPLPLTQLNRILRRPYAEVLVTFMYYRIQMSLYNPKCSEHMVELFGGTTWRDYRNKETRSSESRLLDYYERRLAAPYRTRLRIPFSPEDNLPNPSSRTKYFLVHATHSRHSHVLMRYACQNIEQRIGLPLWPRR
jgi:three-Cys-motif partner protein